MRKKMETFSTESGHNLVIEVFSEKEKQLVHIATIGARRRSGEIVAESYVRLTVAEVAKLIMILLENINLTKQWKRDLPDVQENVNKEKP